ncbi:hypothetical protein BJ546DRAFT_599720 [Cryomyces antarcticus]|uniref:Dioxygenase n=1 Tax=Cryomyces antarcticus TaxID=329879 RepID=A0ABR0KV05_9PEZI|nr:hypothetical protein LTR39_000005 [Cryomyces antarcticus]KAK5021401.1 hypothetical protein LTR60_000017 [Cryomyces antarcticus]KAK5132140.1 hypothetical protein LTR16_000020 [Cryomyces antarcticus]
MAPSAVSPEPVTSNGSAKQAPVDLKAEKKYAKAIKLIESRLPHLACLNKVVCISLDPAKPDVFVDTRGEQARIVDKVDVEANCRIQVTPNVIIELVEGKVEPRFAVFKDAIFDETKMPSGEIPLAIGFCDRLCPVTPVEPTKIEDMGEVTLPVPTEDIEQVKADIKKWGYGLVKNSLNPEQLKSLKSAVEQQAAGEDKHGVASKDGGAGAPNQRIWTLVNKGQEFLDLLDHPLIDEVVPEFLGDGAIITSYSANIARPGNTPMQLHTDQIAIQPPIREVAFGLNIMWFLTDVTRENGGTRVFPGSHIGPIAPADLFNIDGTVAAAGPAGTALVFESRLWHCTGPNEMKTGERPVILLFFMRSFIRQQENNFLSLRAEVEANLSDRHKEFLGYVATGAVGGVEGKVLAGTYASKVEKPVGPYREGVTA